jgi:hypothetical protein
MVWLGACSAPKLRAAALPLGSLRPETGPEKWALIRTSEQGSSNLLKLAHLLDSFQL